MELLRWLSVALFSKLRNSDPEFPLLPKISQAILLSMANFLQLNDVRVYRRALALSNMMWMIINSWKPFAKDTIGKQLMRAADSISANIAEGFGRYYKKEKLQFYRYSRGSVYESLDGVQKAYDRALLTEQQHKCILGELQKIPPELNGFMKLTNAKLRS